MKRFSDPKSIPEFGAIFMSNRSTKEECFRRKLFGLPPNFSTFVKNVKAGMVLFLFEYEKRKLYGVFEAVSDGGMNIVPHAYNASGKSFPAQVKFRVIWDCSYLSELEFCGAIKENYYANYKFSFGPSEEQVCRLLWLFDSRRIIQKNLATNVNKHLSRSLNEANPMLVSENSGIHNKKFIGEDMPENISSTGSQSVPLSKEMEHEDVSGCSTSLVFEDYIPLSSLEHSDPLLEEAPCLSDNIRTVRGMYSDMRNNKPSVFSRLTLSSSVSANRNLDNLDVPNAKKHELVSHLGLVSKNLLQVTEEKCNFLRSKYNMFSHMNPFIKDAVEENESDSKEMEYVCDLSVPEIMEKLQHKVDNWKKKDYKTKRNSQENEGVSLRKRASVFSRLSVTSEASVQKKDRKRKRGHGVILKNSGDPMNQTTNLAVIEDAFVGEEDPRYTQNWERTQEQTKILDFYHAELLAELFKADGRNCNHKAANSYSSEEHQKEGMNMQLASEGNSATKENGGSTEVVDDGVFTQQKNGGDRYEGMPNENIDDLSGARDKKVTLAVPGPLIEHQLRCLIVRREDCGNCEVIFETVRVDDVLSQKVSGDEGEETTVKDSKLEDRGGSKDNKVIEPLLQYQ